MRPLHLLTRERRRINISISFDLTWSQTPELLYLDQSLLSKQLNLIKKIEFNKFISKKSNNYDLKATDNIERDIKVNSDEQLFRILQSIVLKRTKKKIIFVADNEKNKEKLIFLTLFNLIK